MTLPVTPPKVGAGLVLASGAHDNEAAGNDLTGAGEGTGILHEDAGTAGNVLAGNAIRGYGDGIRFVGDGGALLRGCILEGNGTALRFDASASPATRVTANDITGSAPPQVTAAIAIELSDAGSGNYWGHDCAGGPPYFDPAADSDNPLAADSHPYGIPVAALQVPPAPPGCAPAAVDVDGDGYASIASGGDDCDDLDPNTYPGAIELCDQKDNDCDGTVDDGACGTVVAAPQPPVPGSPAAAYRLFGPVQVSPAGFSATVVVPAEVDEVKVYLIDTSGKGVGDAQLLKDGTVFAAAPPISGESQAIISPGLGSGTYQFQVTNLSGTMEVVDPTNVCAGAFVDIPAEFTQWVVPPFCDSPSTCWPPLCADPPCFDTPVPTTCEVPPCDCGNPPCAWPEPNPPCPGPACSYNVPLDNFAAHAELRLVAEKNISRPGTRIDVELLPSGRRMVAKHDLVAKRQAKITPLELNTDTYAAIRQYGDPKGSIELAIVDISDASPQTVISEPAQGLVTDQPYFTARGHVDDDKARVFLDGQEIETVPGGSLDFEVLICATRGEIMTHRFVTVGRCGGISLASLNVLSECWADEQLCDGFDDDCDGEVDEGFDRDGDGFTSCGVLGPAAYCAGAGPQAPDCDDNDPTINPDAPELCDAVDNNCDGSVDEGFGLVDADGDGFGVCGSGSLGDCDDTNPRVYPGAGGHFAVCDDCLLRQSRPGWCNRECVFEFCNNADFTDCPYLAGANVTLPPGMKKFPVMPASVGGVLPESAVFRCREPAMVVLYSGKYLRGLVNGIPVEAGQTLEIYDGLGSPGFYHGWAGDAGSMTITVNRWADPDDPATPDLDLLDHLGVDLHAVAPVVAQEALGWKCVLPPEPFPCLMGVQTNPSSVDVFWASWAFYWSIADSFEFSGGSVSHAEAESAPRNPLIPFEAGSLNAERIRTLEPEWFGENVVVVQLSVTTVLEVGPVSFPAEGAQLWWFLKPQVEADGRLVIPLWGAIVWVEGSGIHDMVVGELLKPVAQVLSSCSGDFECIRSECPYLLLNTGTCQGGCTTCCARCDPSTRHCRERDGTSPCEPSGGGDPSFAFEKGCELGDRLLFTIQDEGNGDNLAVCAGDLVTGYSGVPVLQRSHVGYALSCNPLVDQAVCNPFSTELFLNSYQAIPPVLVLEKQ